MISSSRPRVRPYGQALTFTQNVKSIKQSEAMTRRFHLTVIFVEGQSRSGKSTTDLLSNSLIEAVKKFVDQMRTRLKQSVRWILGGRNHQMDDLMRHGNDRFRLASTNGSRASWKRVSARYKNKKVAPRVLLINSEKTPWISLIHWKFSWSVDRSNGSSRCPHIKIGSQLDSKIIHDMQTVFKSTCEDVRTPRPTG